MFMNPSAPATRAIQGLVLTIAALAATSAAFAQTALVSDVHTVTTSDSPATVEHSFTITSPGAYTVTLSDLGAALTPSAPLASVEMAVTQGNAIVGAPQILTGTGSITLNVTATATYILHVIGAPGTTLGSGPIEEDVAPSGGGTKLYSFIDAIQNPPQQQSTSVATVDNTFTAPVTGTYTVTLADLQFPASLQGVMLLLADNTSSQGATLTAAGSTQLALNAGDSCAILAIGQEASTAAGGLFSVSLTPPAGTASFYSTNVVPIGGVTLLQPDATTKGVLNLGAGSTTITVNDLQFPQALDAAGVAVIDSSGQSVTGTTYPAITSSTTTHTASGSFTASAGSYQVFGYATATTAATVGSYAVVLTQGTTPVFDDALAVGTTGGLLEPYSFDANVTTAGAYNVTLTDFQFPSPLTAVQFAAEQNGSLLANPAMAAGSFTVSPAQGQVTFLAFAQATGSGGIFGLDMSSGSGATAAFDTTQGVGAGFKMIPFTVSSAQTLGVTAADVQFPSALSTLEAAVTTGTTVEGKIIAGGSSSGSTTPITGSFAFSASPGTTYFVNVLAQPASPAKAGTYALTVMPAPVVTLTPSVTSVNSGGTVTLTWSTQNATSCTASGGSGWSGSESPSGGSVTTSALTATTTFSLSCTGGGGTGSASAAVTVTTPSSSGKSGGGGALDLASILALASLLAVRAARLRRPGRA
jgi:hypothetical protein